MLGFEAYSAAPLSAFRPFVANVIAAPLGVSAQLSLNDVDAFTDYTEISTGNTLLTNTGTLSFSLGCTAFPEGTSSTVSLGDAVAAAAATGRPSGVSANFTNNSVTAQGGTDAPLVGVAAEAVAGEPLISGDANFALTGVQSDTALGDVVASIAVTAEVTSPGVIPTATGTVKIRVSITPVVTGVSMVGSIGNSFIWGIVNNPSSADWGTIAPDADATWTVIDPNVNVNYDEIEA